MLSATEEEAKLRVPHAEFLTWVEYFRRKIKRRDKSEFYLGHLRWEVYMLRKTVNDLLNNTKLPKAEPKDFLMTHEEVGEDRHTRLGKVGGRPTYTPADGKTYIETSKAAWMARLGLVGG